jgi:DNA-binding NarL/FixJ family response regulator
MESLEAEELPLSPAVRSGRKQSIRVLIADGTHIGCELLKNALTRYRKLVALCSRNNLNDVVTLAGDFCPDILLISCDFEDGGISLLQQLSAALPQIPVVVQVDHTSEDLIVEAFRSGVRGVFRRSQSLSQLVKCLSVVNQGQVWASSADLIAVMGAFATTARSPIVKSNGDPMLSPREQQVAQLTAEGMTNREIGERLQISEHTVKNYLFKIYDKLGVSTRVELVLYAAAHKNKIG